MMENKEKAVVSVIVPVYNVEKYLCQCVDSVLSQEYPHLEVILVDDGSSDSSPEICDNYALQDGRVKVIHKKNSGAAESRNIGLEEAKGEYVLFIDSDDYWIDQTVVGNLVSKFENEDQRWDFLNFNFNKYYQREKKIIKDRAYPHFCKDRNKDEKIISLISCGIFPMSPCNKLIRRDFLVLNKIRFKKGITAEDIPWFFELLEKCKDFGCINYYAYVYRRQVDTSVTAINNYSDKKFGTALYLLNTGIRHIKDSDSSLELKQAYFSYYAYFYFILLGRFRSVSAQKRQETKKLLKSYAWLLDYRLHPKVNKVVPFYRILGFTVMSYLFHFYMKKFKA